MWLLGFLVAITGAALALRGSRWAAHSLLASRAAYAAAFVIGPLRIPAQAGFRIAAPDCEWTFGPALALHSLTNYPHIILFAVFFLVSCAQFTTVPKAFAWSLGACLVLGFLVELAQGVSGNGHCRMRDLIPDTAGALAAASLISVGRKVMPFARKLPSF